MEEMVMLNMRRGMMGAVEVSMMDGGLVRKVRELRDKGRKRGWEEGEGSPWELGILSPETKLVRTIIKKDSCTFNFNGMNYYDNDTRGESRVSTINGIIVSRTLTEDGQRRSNQEYKN